jgi:hypothetical protein
LVYPGAANLKSLRPTGSGDLANTRKQDTVTLVLP